MKRSLWIAGMLVALMGMMHTANAQHVKIIRRGAGNVMLLQSSAIQKELKLTPEQKTKAETKVKAVRAAMEEQLKNGSALEQEEIDKAQEESTKDQKKFLAELLKEEQLKRFQQLELQAMGPDTFARKEVLKALEITKEQQNRIEFLAEEQNEKLHALFAEGAGGDQEEMGKRMQEQRADHLKGIMALLTEAQTKKWKEMTGEPFKFDPPKFQIRRNIG